MENYHKIEQTTKKLGKLEISKSKKLYTYNLFGVIMTRLYVKLHCFTTKTKKKTKIGIILNMQQQQKIQGSKKAD